MIDKQKIDTAIASINNILQDDWRNQSDDLDFLISNLTAREMHHVWSDKRTNPDIVPYISSYHVSWLFEICWAEQLEDPDGYTKHCADAGIPVEDVPDNYDPDIPLGNIFLWAPQDHLSRLNNN
jgi:hypothetical protein